MGGHVPPVPRELHPCTDTCSPIKTVKSKIFCLEAGLIEFSIYPSYVEKSGAERLP